MAFREPRREEMAKASRKSNAAVAAPQAEVKFPSTAELVAAGFTTKSARIRELHRLGMKTGAIAKQETNGLYQHAYNVIKRPVKRPAAEVAAPAAETDVSE
jgi:hypothetical protein